MLSGQGEHAAHDESVGEAQEDSLKNALALARAEIDAAESEPVPCMTDAAKRELEARALEEAEPDAPVRFTREMAAGCAGAATARSDKGDAGGVQHDAETTRKLKMLRRLNPAKTEEALLAQLAEDHAAPVAVKKKGWFSRG